MAKKRRSIEQHPGALAAALVVAGCCVVLGIAMWAPLTRAQLILFALPGLMAVAAAAIGPGRRK